MAGPRDGDGSGQRVTAARPRRQHQRPMGTPSADIRETIVPQIPRRPSRAEAGRLADLAELAPDVPASSGVPMAEANTSP
jgi:hypothetical protein